jgi:hypothetical protein
LATKVFVSSLSFYATLSPIQELVPVEDHQEAHSRVAAEEEKGSAHFGEEELRSVLLSVRNEKSD